MRKLLLLAAVAALITAVPAAAAATVPPGVTVGGVAVAGMTRADAATAVRNAYLSGSVRVRVDASSFRYGVSRFDLRLSLRAALDAAMLATAPGDYPVTLRYSVPLVHTYADHIWLKTGQFPRDASWRFHGKRPIVLIEKSGMVAPRGSLRAAIVRQIRNPALRAAGVDVPRTVAQPTVTLADLPPALVIIRGANQLRFYRYRMHHVQRLRTFGVATGRPAYPTPRGTYAIVVKQRNPWWYPPASPWAQGLKPIPPGPGNPLGTRWMGLSAPGVGIHGTPDAASIGYSASHGCIRMRIPDAEWLFDRVTVGTPVKIL